MSHIAEPGHGKIVNISVSETTMRRRGFTPYGPPRAATDALSHIMAADLAGTGIDVNPAASRRRHPQRPDTRFGAVEAQPTWLDPAIMGPPVVWLASEFAAQAGQAGSNRTGRFGGDLNISPWM